MKLTIQHLQRILSSKQENNKSLDLLLNQIDVLDEIVTSFSHFAQMPTPLAEPFDVIYVLEKSIDLHVDKSIEKVILSDKAVILGDEKLFGRVFNNLILNAFESMKKIKHPNVQVKLEIEGGNRVKISIQDFGEGIPDDVQGKVFIPNFTTKETGSGIGLAVAKRGIEHAGGEIWFETTLNKGTVFYIAMPLYKSEE
jgi:signal transduction histidine kinase